MADPTTETPKDKPAISSEALDQLFREARTHSAWQARPVPQALLEEVYNLAKYGPTSANSCPMRLVFVQSEAAKARLLPVMAPGNVDKTKAAPVTALIAYDMEFYEKLPKLFPFADARSWFAGNEKLIADTAFRNSALQGAYFMLAARALGLDCGPMSGFDADKLNAEFFPDGKWRINFVCNLGYGAKALPPRAPRLEFGEVCSVI